MSSCIELLFHAHSVGERILNSEKHRLRGIYQLGLRGYVLEVRDRSRYTHMRNAGEIALLYALSSLDYFNDPYKLCVLVVASIIHDIGHVPFSHDGEEIVRKFMSFDHRRHGINIVKEKYYDFLERSGIDCDEVCRAIKKRDPFISQRNESGLGVDKLEYTKNDLPVIRRLLRKVGSNEEIDAKRISYISNLYLEGVSYDGDRLFCQDELHQAAAEILYNQLQRNYEACYYSEKFKSRIKPLKESIISMIKDGYISLEEFLNSTDRAVLRRHSEYVERERIEHDLHHTPYRAPQLQASL
jgi:hypothetical protein